MKKKFNFEKLQHFNSLTDAEKEARLLLFTDYINSEGFKINNTALFKRALTHSSYKLVTSDAKSYERLEFLGDAVIGLIISEALFLKYPKFDEGKLTKMKISFVRGGSLAEKARELHFEKFMRYGKSISEQELLANDKYFEDVFEAFVAALYIDQGLQLTAKYVNKLFAEEIENFDFSNIIDYKSTLQEYVQSDKRGELNYEVTQTGPANAPTFYATVYYDGLVLGKGQGSKRKEAEQAAAREALLKVAK